MRNNQGTETEEFLSMLFDAFSETYDIAAMGGAIHPIYAIFTQKAQYQLRDNSPVDDIPDNDPFGGSVSAEELNKRIMENVVDV